MYLYFNVTFDLVVLQQHKLLYCFFKLFLYFFSSSAYPGGLLCSAVKYCSVLHSSLVPVLRTVVFLFVCHTKLCVCSLGKKVPCCIVVIELFKWSQEFGFVVLRLLKI